MNNKSIKFNALLNGIRTVLNLIFPLITFPYISRVLAVDEIGKYNFSNSIVTYFLLFAVLGIDKYAVREGSKYRCNRKEISNFASEIFSLNIISTIIAYILLFVYLFLSKKASLYQSCILILSLQIFFTTLGTEWLFSIFEDYTFITIRSIAFKLVSIVLLFLFVRKEGDSLIYTWITVFASVGSNILNFIYAKKFCDIRIRLFDLDWKRMLSPVLIIFASNVAIQIYVNADITMLGYIQGDYMVGIYSVSSKIYAMVKSVFAAMLVVTIPRFSLYAGKKMKEEYKELLNDVLNILLVFIIPAMIGLVILGRDVILIIAGEKYLVANTSLSVLSFSLIFALLSSLLNQCVLLPYLRERVFLKSSFISATLNIVLNLFFIPKYGCVGAAITTLISEMMMVIINIMGSKDILLEFIYKKDILNNIYSVLVGSIIVAGVCLASVKLIQNMMFQMLAAVVGSVVFYFVFLVCIKNKIIMTYLNNRSRSSKEMHK